MINARTAVLVAALSMLTAVPAFADLTGFVGTNTTPENRVTTGVAIGTGLLIVGIEFEYSATSDDKAEGAPSLKVGSGNFLLQTPVEFYGIQPYFTAGFGIYNESLALHSHTGVAPNLGGGAKITLIGPIRLRVDYRVFRLGDSALYSPARRIYAGLNLRF